MAFEHILSVSGKSGLFRLVGQMKNGIIVESIEDGKRFPVHGSAKVSALDEISIYTMEEEMPLKDVFKKIYEKQNGKQAISHKEDNNKIKAFFKEVLPEYDPERVYVSDMIKVVKWYNLLIEFKAYDPNEKEEVKEQEQEEKAGAKKGKKAKKEDTEVKEEAKEAPKKAAKKPAAKKKTDKPGQAKTAVPKASTKAKTVTAKSAPKKAGGNSKKG